MWIECVRKSGFVLLLPLAAAFAQAPPAADEPAGIAAIAVDEVKPGMHGYGLSVFQGSVPERFEVEILGVLKNPQPEESFILARLKGGDLEKTGIIAGMSGSPVYLDGRLAGAVSFTWPFSKEPIAGITPIESMRAIPRLSGAGGTAAGPVAAAPDWRALVAPRPGGDRLGEKIEQFTSWAASGDRGGLLWSASGFGEGARARLARSLPTLAPLGGGGPGTASVAEAAARLVPGASVAQLFVDGDLRLAGTGTVTARDGDRILAFGHAVTGLGAISMPLASSEVITVLPSQFNSFKIANSGAILGAFDRDHPSGVSGRLGAEARMVPVHLDLAAIGAPPASAKRFDFRVAEPPPLVASLTGIGLLGAWDSISSFGGGKSVDIDLRVDLDGREPVRVAQTFDGAGATNSALGYAVAVIDFLARNDLGPLKVTGIDVSARSAEANRGAKIASVRPDRTLAAPGDEVALTVELRDWSGAPLRYDEKLVLPAELPDGRYTLLVGDGASIDAARLQTASAPPATLDQVLDVLRSLRSSSELVIAGLLPSGGISSAGEAMPRLPGSMRSIWGLAGVRATSPLRNALLQEAVRPKDRPLDGLVRVDLEIRRKLEQGRGD